MKLLGVWVGFWCLNATVLSAPIQGLTKKGYIPTAHQSKEKHGMALLIPEDGLSIPPCRDFFD